MTTIYIRKPDLPSPRRDGRSRHAARADRKLRCTAAPMNRTLVALSLAAAGLGLAACSTHSAGTSALAVPSTSRPTTAASTGPTESAPRASAGTQPPSTDAPACAAELSWGTAPRDGGTAMTTAPLYLAHAGQHECYDRVVFDLNGPEAVGYTARYVPLVSTDGSGAPMPVEGRAALEVTVRGPIYGTDNQGHQPWRQPPAVGEDLIAPANLAGWASLAEVKFAGSFEGQTTFAVGVRDTRPFRIWINSEQDYQHVVVDIAH
jgi:hypothetical protein